MVLGEHESRAGAQALLRRATIVKFCVPNLKKSLQTRGFAFGLPDSLPIICLKDREGIVGATGERNGHELQKW
jgi:hypothetical protein